ncbi:MAG TPA: hypothetical protein VEA58_08720 [Anaerovoracaceae bacterium]|nr:hypothetical protein [Anaerovoracaceae bacterium]
MVKIIIRLLRIGALLGLSIVLLFLALVMPTWPTKAKLCKDVEQYLPKAECMQLENHVEIVKRAFPEGKVSTSDVKSALREYLHNERPDHVWSSRSILPECKAHRLSF